ncbi:hypothetical protein GF327_03625 [Candidatus Woesearchaeota archaeon]|nr:hypothetical protein [Candidatus Woesearchaeota archaeon]
MDMKILKNIVCVILIILSAGTVISQISSDSDIIQLEKQKFNRLEKIQITVKNHSEKRLVILSENNFYSITDLKKTNTFLPTNPGDYQIRLLDKNQEILFQKKFQVSGRKSAHESFGTIKIINKDNKEIFSDYRFISKNKIISENELISPGNYDIEIEPENIDIKKIKFNKFNFTGRFYIKLDKINIKKISNKKIVKAFAIDSNNLKFEETEITAQAKGTELWKCSDFDFSGELCSSKWKKIKNIIPGNEYFITVYDKTAGFAETGVATVNTEKPIYHPDEIVNIYMVVLDNSGFLVTNAHLNLEITSPKNQKYNLKTPGDIKEIKKGIYRAEFSQISVPGNYIMKVIAKAENTDSDLISYFTVRDSYEFDILRNNPLTIDPWKGPFFSSISIRTYVDASYFSFTEILPSSFTIHDSGTGLVTNHPDHKEITWTGLENDSEVYYTANSPLKTPELYEIGPSRINYDDKIFTEARPWYLAVDPVLNINASGCSKHSNASSSNTFDDACSDPYNLSLEDGNYQIADAQQDDYCGIEAVYNQDLEDCAKINRVDVCIDWWFTGTVLECLGVNFTGTGTSGTWYTSQLSSCPEANGDMICSDETSYFDWNCNSFTGDNAAIRAQLRSQTDSSHCIYDAVYFNINYSAYPNITGNITNNGPVIQRHNITFTGNCTDLDPGDNFRLIVCNSSTSECNATTAGNDLICKGEFTDSNSPNCTYTAGYDDIGLHTGDIGTCCDAEGNCNPVLHDVEDWQILSGTPDLTTETQFIHFSDESPSESENITINSTIKNIGNGTVYNITIQFWDEHPDSNGLKINGNRTIDKIMDKKNKTINITYKFTSPGPHEIYVLIDPGEDIHESNETNNEIYKVINVPSWHIYFGNLSSLIVLGDAENKTKITWNSENPSIIYIVESGTDINWDNLQALTRNTTDEYEFNDFEEFDDMLNMTYFSDSVNNTFTINFQPKKTVSFEIYDRTINNVPIINSTNSSTFVTGVLWDTNDGNTHYNGTQDIVFFTNSTEKKQGKYGTYDYELSVPALLREYKLGSDKLTMYVEIK